MWHVKYDISVKGWIVYHDDGAVFPMVAMPERAAVDLAAALNLGAGSTHKQSLMCGS